MDSKKENHKSLNNQIRVYKIEIQHLKHKLNRYEEVLELCYEKLSKHNVELGPEFDIEDVSADESSDDSLQPISD